ERAQHYFELHCREWWDLGDFHKNVDGVRREILRLKEMERERQHRIAEKKDFERQAGLRNKVDGFLRQGRFHLADEAHRECAEFWPIDAYMREREISRQAHRSGVKKRWEARRNARQDALRRMVTFLLQDLDVDAADLAYEHCKAWWPK